MTCRKFWILLFLGTFLLSSCSSDDDNFTPDNPDQPSQPEQPDPDAGAYADGFFVTNEGQFPNAGSVSYISTDLDTVKQHIFESVNGEDPGSVIQSMFFDGDDRAYVIANNSNMISVVDRYSFERVGQIDEGLDLPRYGVVVNQKAYVTNQAQNAYVAVIDLETLTVETTIPLEGSAEYIKKADNGMIYVQNASFNTGHTISVIDPSENEVVNTLTTADELNSFALDHETLYALTPGKIEEFDLSGNSTATIDLNYETNPGNITVSDQTIYFTVGNAVYSMSNEATAAPESSLLTYTTSSSFGAMYGFTVKDNRIYIADGGDFASDSFVIIYDNNGQKLKKLDVGIGPNGFYF